MKTEKTQNKTNVLTKKQCLKKEPLSPNLNGLMLKNVP